MMNKKLILLTLIGITTHTAVNAITNVSNSIATTIKNKSQARKADSLGIFTTEDKLKELLKNTPCAYLPQLAKDTHFKASKSSVMVVPLQDQPYKYLIIAGLGKKNDTLISFENYRRAVAKIIRTADSYSTKTIDLELPSANLFDVSPSYLIEQTVATANITNHKFDVFLSDQAKRTHPFALSLILKEEAADIESALNKGHIISGAVNQARHWVDLPPNYLTTEVLAHEAQKIANTHGLKATIWNGEQIAKIGMGGLKAVSQGSSTDCRFVLLEYNCGIADAPTIALVGKGITYDTGGLSIKPTHSMINMKCDMGGAAAVLATMQAIGQLKPKINVIGCTPLAENMISGSSYRPGDIIKFYNGKTAFIGNTDAEGRLVLADGLAYVTKHYNLDAVFDLATLTGSARVALGRFFSGLFSEHDDLANRVEKAAKVSGDYVWRLPLTDDYKPAIKNDIADLQNIEKPAYSGGATTAACFLQHFVGNTPWVHLDIAPTAFNPINLPYFRANSATGSGVRLMVEVIMNWNND
jgi:leucyl aminopeptidase